MCSTENGSGENVPGCDSTRNSRLRVEPRPVDRFAIAAAQTQPGAWIPRSAISAANDTPRIRGNWAKASIRAALVASIWSDSAIRVACSLADKSFSPAFRNQLVVAQPCFLWQADVDFLKQVHFLDLTGVELGGVFVSAAPPAPAECRRLCPYPIGQLPCSTEPANQVQYRSLASCLTPSRPFLRSYDTTFVTGNQSIDNSPSLPQRSSGGLRHPQRQRQPLRMIRRDPIHSASINCCASARWCGWSGFNVQATTCAPRRCRSAIQSKPSSNIRARSSARTYHTRAGINDQSASLPAPRYSAGVPQRSAANG